MVPPIVFFIFVPSVKCHVIPMGNLYERMWDTFHMKVHKEKAHLRQIMTAYVLTLHC